MNASDAPIASPCDADWSSMSREGARRFCDSCDKHVHDLSAMTPDAATALLAGRGQTRVCVRYRHRADGSIVFADPAPAPAPELVPLTRLARRAAAPARRSAPMAAAAGVVMALSLAACTPHDPRGEVMGELKANPALAQPAKPDPAPLPAGAVPEEEEVMGDVMPEPEPETVEVKGDVAPMVEAEPCVKSAAPRQDAQQRGPGLAG